MIDDSIMLLQICFLNNNDTFLHEKIEKKKIPLLGLHSPPKKIG